CKVERLLEWPQRTVVVGQVLHMTVRDACFAPGGRYVDPATYQPIARLHADNYIVADRQFVLPLPPYPGEAPHGL
ncbi:MAG: flavin reductase family protein, partial [Paracoccaceae bacterium]